MDANQTTRPLWTILCLLLMSGCAEPLPDLLGLTQGFDPERYQRADAFRGGLLYDNWWVTQGTPAPQGDHPDWRLQSSNPRRGPDTWRCKECHGWDYLGRDGAYGRGSTHYTGFPGILDAALQRSPEDLYDFFLNSGNNRHGFGSRLALADIYDLIRFIKSGDDQGIPTRPLSAALLDDGDPTRGADLYRDHCSDCHGPDGSGQFPAGAPETVGDIARDNPQEFLHKARFGQPGTLMRRGQSYDRNGAMTLQDSLDLLAYARTLQADGGRGSPGGFDPARYQNADPAYGGRLYDAWWTAKGLDNIPVGGEHPLWARQDSNPRRGGDTWRCKECHGWDYRGRDGAYGPDSSHYTGFPGILEASGPDRDEPAELYAYLAQDPDHAYPPGTLDEDDLYALVRFVMERRQEGDPAAWIDDRTAQAIAGSVSGGENYYHARSSGACANSGCHGPDGRAIDFADGDPDTPPNEFLDDLAKRNPWEFLHKIRFGQPGSPMPAMADDPELGLSEALGVLKYAQTWLAPDPQRGGRLYDHWMDERQLGADERPTAHQTKLRDGKDPETGESITQETSWRCVTCHGWDYQGRGSMPSLLSVDRLGDARQIADKIARGGNTHRFGDPLRIGLRPPTPGLTDTDVADLAHFLLEAVANRDVSTAILQGDAQNGNDLYNGVRKGGDCAACHGVDDPNLTRLAIEAPARFVHKARFGQPASVMTPGSQGFLGLDLEQAADVLAYVRGWQGGGGDAFERADLVRGGRLFDNWWQELGLTPPSGTNPLWERRDPAVTLDIAAPDSWRCVTCHRWDYRGVGFYRSSSGRILSKDDLVALPERYANLLDPAALRRHVFDWIAGNKSRLHDFSSLGLQEQDLWDLSKFLLGGGVIDTTYYYSPATGDIVVPELPDLQRAIDNGRDLYLGQRDPDIDCSACHGPDGTATPPGGTRPLDIFQLAQTQPEAFFHKVRFGQPGSAMISIFGARAQALGDKLSLNRAARDLLGYAREEFKNRSQPLGTQGW